MVGLDDVPEIVKRFRYGGSLDEAIGLFEDALAAFVASSKMESQVTWGEKSLHRGNFGASLVDASPYESGESEGDSLIRQLRIRGYDIAFPEPYLRGKAQARVELEDSDNPATYHKHS
jgi:hypothetical protein